MNDERAREVCERLRKPLVIGFAVPLPVAETLQRAAGERGQSADLIEAYAARVRVLEEALTHIASATRLGPITDLSAWQSLANACQKTARAALLQETNHAG